MSDLKESDLPEILAVNIDQDIAADLTSNFFSIFKTGWSRYNRPSRKNHPPMRPVLGSREFQVIVFDTGSAVAQMTPEEALSLQILPEWFRNDVIKFAETALLVILTPADPQIQAAVKAHFAPVEKHDLREVNYMFREPSQWRAQGVDPAGDILRLWRERTVDTGGSWFSKVSERVSEFFKPMEDEN